MVWMRIAERLLNAAAAVARMAWRTKDTANARTWKDPKVRFNAEMEDTARKRPYQR